MAHEFLGVEHEFELSDYQKNIVKWVVDGSGNAIVNAVAGSGKTSTLKAISKYLNGKSAVFLAFNKHVATELSQKLRGVSVSTIHSLGFKALNYKFRGLNVDGRKYTKKLREEFKDEREILESCNDISKIIDLTRLKFVDPTVDNIEDITYEFDIQLDIDINRVTPIVRNMLKWGENLSDHMTVDFTDMVYLPVKLNFRTLKFDWVLVDEAQDLNMVQRLISYGALNKNGRMIFVGDRRQAIYGFAGASVKSMDEISKEINANEFPLSVCYRCPKKHVELAKEIVPEIEYSSFAKDGDVNSVDYYDATKMIKSGDLVICRLNAPLVDLCFSLISNGVAAKIRGSDIGKKLIEIIEKISKPKSFKFSKFEEHLDKRLEKVTIGILKRNKDDKEDPAIKKQEDMFNALKRIYECSGAKNIKSLINHIENLFGDDNAVVWLSTVHKAKGLEAENVWILRPDKMPLSAKMGEEQVKQEYNLKYVALTRAMAVLNFIVGEGNKKSENSTLMFEKEDDIYREQDLDSYHQNP